METTGDSECLTLRHICSLWFPEDDIISDVIHRKLCHINVCLRSDSPEAEPVSCSAPIRTDEQWSCFVSSFVCVWRGSEFQLIVSIKYEIDIFQ